MDICRDDWQWERTKSCYEEIKKDYTLIYTTDIDTYLTLLQDTRYTIFISVRDECADALKDTTLNHLKKLGFRSRFKRKISLQLFSSVIQWRADGAVSF